MQSNTHAYAPSSIASVLTQFGCKLNLGKPVNEDTPYHATHGLPRISVRQICQNMGGTLQIGELSVRVPTAVEIHAELSRMAEVMNALYRLTASGGVVQVTFGPTALYEREAAAVLALARSLRIWLRNVENVALSQVSVEVVTQEFLPDPPKSRGNGGERTEGDGSTRCVGDCLDLGRFDFLNELVTLECRIEVRGGLGRSKKENGYWAYIVRTGSGARLALLDTPVKDNALFVFDADVEGWEEVARLPKPDVRHGGHRAFKDRITHSAKWQDKVRKLIDA